MSFSNRPSGVIILALAWAVETIFHTILRLVRSLTTTHPRSPNHR